MGSSGKGGGENWAQVAGEQGYTQWSQGGTPGMASDAKNYEGYMTGWNMRQGEHDSQLAQQNMFNSFMSSMNAPSQMSSVSSGPTPPTAAEQATSAWASEGMFDKNSSFASIQKQLGSIGEGQSYLYGAGGGSGSSSAPSGTPTWTTAGGESVADEDVALIAGQLANKFTGEPVSKTGFSAGSSSGGDNWYIGDTPDFGSEETGPGYEGPGYTAGGVSFKEGRGLRDTAMENYTDALGSAEKFVDSQMAQERTNSRLMGITYNTSADIRSSRIGQALGDHGWGESQQNDFAELLSSWGSVGYEQSITPTAGGVSTTGQTSTPGSTGPASTTPVGSTAVTEEDTLGQTSLLGG